MRLTFYGQMVRCSTSRCGDVPPAAADALNADAIIASGILGSHITDGIQVKVPTIFAVRNGMREDTVFTHVCLCGLPCDQFKLVHFRTPPGPVSPPTCSNLITLTSLHRDQSESGWFAFNWRLSSANLFSMIKVEINFANEMKIWMYITNRRKLTN